MSFKSDMFFVSLNQLGRVNELLIKPELSDLTEPKEEEDGLEVRAEEGSGSGADCVSTATDLESALNQVPTSWCSLEIHSGALMF